MSIWQQFKSWFCDQSVPRWQMLSGATMLLFANSGVSYWIQTRDYSASVEMAAQQEVRGRMTEVRLVALDFQTYAANYVGSVVAGKDLSVAEKSLIENVMRQHSAVELSKGVYTDETLALADEYQRALATFNAVVPRSDDVVEMGPFWQAASMVLVTRDAFLMSLERQAMHTGA